MDLQSVDPDRLQAVMDRRAAAWRDAGRAGMATILVDIASELPPLVWIVTYANGKLAATPPGEIIEFTEN